MHLFKKKCNDTDNHSCSNLTKDEISKLSIKKYAKRIASGLLAFSVLVTGGAFSNLQFAKAAITRANTFVVVPYAPENLCDNVESSDGVIIHDGTEGRISGTGLFSLSAYQGSYYTDIYKRYRVALNCKDSGYGTQVMEQIIKTNLDSTYFQTTLGMSRSGYSIDYFTDIDGDRIKSSNIDNVSHVRGDHSTIWVDENNMLIVFPHWISSSGTPRTYYITGSKGNGTLYDMEQEANSNYFKLSAKNPTKSGYIFNGWAINSWAGSIINTNAPRSVAKSDGSRISDTRLYATWRKDYTVKFFSNDTSGVLQSQTMTVGKSAALRTNTFSRAGYKFKGWSTSSSATSPTYTDGQTVTDLCTTNGDSITLYAVWKANTNTLKFDPNGGTCNESSRNVDTDSVYGALPTPEKKGYNFDGWYAENGTRVASDTVMSAAAETTVTAHWSARTDCQVICIDRCDGNEIGRTTFNGTFGTNTSGAVANGNVSADDAKKIGKFYSSKIYTGCTSAVVKDSGTVVYREFTDYSATKLPDGTVLSEDRTKIISVPNTATEVFINQTSGITAIAENAFKGCTNLKKFEMETNTITSIGANAFNGCTNISSLDLKYSVSEIGQDAFAGCSNLTKIAIKNPECEIYDNNTTIPGSAVLHGFLGSSTVDYATKYAKSCVSITDIEDGFFLNETSMTSFVIPENVKNIGKDAFKNCTNLVSLTMGSNVEKIGDNAFQNDPFTNVVLPKTLKSIGDKAFADCINLVSANFSEPKESVCESIGEGAFARTALTYGKNESTAPSNVMYIPATVKTIGADAFLGCTKLGQVTIAGENTIIESVSAIPKSTVIACYDGSKAYDFAISNDYLVGVFVGYKEDSAASDEKYMGNTNIYSVSLGKYATTIGERTFKDCESLVAVYSEDDVITKVKTEAFSGCTSLKMLGNTSNRLALGFKVAEIEENAFADCTDATDLYIENPNVKIFDSESTIANNITLHSYSKSTTFDYANKYSEVKTFKSSGTSYQIIFNKNGGYDGTDKVYAFTGMEWPDIVSPAREGYTLLGYYINDSQCFDADGKFVGDENLQNIADDMTGDSAPVAKWSANSYTIVFDGNTATDGTMEDMDMKYDKSERLEKAGFEKTGYTFVNWNTAADGSGTTYTDADTVNNLTAVNEERVTLYAQWKENTYTIAFNGNGADTGSMDNIDMVYDKSVVLPETTFERGSDYNFVGWNTKADGSGTSYDDKSEVSNLTAKDKETVTLYAQWKAVTKTITYNLAGGTMPEGTINPVLYSFLDTFTLVNPVKTGYEFLGWTGTDLIGYVQTVTVPAGERVNRAYEAHWKLKEYSIQYNLDGGTYEGDKTNPASYNLLSETISINAPVKRGYTFVGWSKGDLEDLTMEPVIVSGTTGDQEYTAHWKINKYKVTLNSDDGIIENGSNITEYTYGTEIVLPEPKKTDYLFEGWFTSEDFDGEQIEKITTNTVGDLTLYAKYSYKVEKQASIHYFDGENEITYGDDSVVLIENMEDYVLTPTTNKITSFTLPSKVEKKGYNFVGWYDNAELSGDMLEHGVYDGEAAYVNLYAKFNPVSYAVTFGNCEDAEIGDEITHYSYEQQTRLPSEVTRTGYSFAGWYMDKDFTGDAITNVPVETIGETVFYAKWEPYEYKITLYLNEGTIIDSAVSGYNYGSEVTLPTNVVRNGCAFEGWYDNKEFSGDAVSTIEKTSMGDKTFYAKWTTNRYNISYVTNGGDIKEGKTETYEFNSETILPTFVERTGYAFAGWYTNLDLSGEPVAKISVTDYGNKTFYAKWNANTYNVNLNLNGGTLVDVFTSYTYGVNTALPTPTKTGYTFVGWCVNADLSGNTVMNIGSEETGNKNYFAKWSGTTSMDSNTVLNKTTTVKSSSSSKKKFTVGNFKYAVKKANKTVTVIGVKSKKKTKLVIPTTVKKDGKKYKVVGISSKAFANCKKLKRVTIGKNVKSIAKNAFKGDKKLKKVTFKASKTKIAKGAFKTVNKKAVYKCTKKSKKVYKKALKKSGVKKPVIK